MRPDKSKRPKTSNLHPRPEKRERVDRVQEVRYKKGEERIAIPRPSKGRSN